MKNLLIKILFIGFASFFALSCNDVESEECETEYSWVNGESTGESGYDHLFYPPDPVCLPRDVSRYKVGRNQIRGFSTWVRGMAVEYLDPSYLTDCEDMQDFDECEEAECTLPDGTVIEYLRTVYIEDKHYNPTTVEDITITPPAEAETWNTIHVYSKITDIWNGAFFIDRYSYLIEWDGTIHPVLPSDYSVEISGRKITGSESTDTEEWTFQHENFQLEAFSGRFTSNHDRVTINDTVVRIGWEGDDIYYAYMDEEQVGQVDPETWELL